MDIAASVFLIVVAAVIIAVIWYAGVRKRAGVSGELQRQNDELRRLLADVAAQLAELNRRTADMHRILKDAD